MKKLLHACQGFQFGDRDFYLNTFELGWQLSVSVVSAGIIVFRTWLGGDEIILRSNLLGIIS
jgi:hypothetical protein